MITLKQAMKMVNNFNDNDNLIRLINVPKYININGNYFCHCKNNFDLYEQIVTPREIKDKLDMRKVMVYKITRDVSLYGEDDGWKFFCKFPK